MRSELQKEHWGDLDYEVIGDFFSGLALFGSLRAVPICRIIVEDESGTLKGTDCIIGDAIEPGSKYQDKKLMTIKEQGASYVPSQPPIAVDYIQGALK